MPARHLPSQFLDPDIRDFDLQSTTHSIDDPSGTTCDLRFVGQSRRALILQRKNVDSKVRHGAMMSRCAKPRKLAGQSCTLHLGGKSKVFGRVEQQFRDPVGTFLLPRHAQNLRIGGEKARHHTTHGGAGH